MGREIERKFLVSGDAWRPNARGERCRQGYLAFGPPVSVRVRVMGGKGTLNLKQSTLAIGRDEFEYDIPIEDANALLERYCQGAVVDKTRYFVEHGGRTWEVDVFAGANAGLIVAEIELEEENAPFERPPWLGDEVSGDARFQNSSLARRPFTEW